MQSQCSTCYDSEKTDAINIWVEIQQNGTFVLTIMTVDDIAVLDISRCGEEECLQTVREACQQLGCFRIVNHGISPDLLRNADLVCREVFKLPTETKKKNISPIPYAGYAGGRAEFPFYESLGMLFSSTPDPEAIKHFSHLMWPQGNQNFCQTMEEYTGKMMELFSKVQQQILASFGVSKYYATHLSRGKVLLRMNMYDISSELPTESIGLRPHTDLGSLAILHGDGSGGLQLYNKAGNWIDVKSIPNSFVAITGDCYQAWSNGRIYNVKHRVMVKRQQSRLCLLFSNGYPDEMDMKALPEFVDDEHPQYYKEFKYGDLVKYWLGDGNGVEERLQAFVGIAT